MFKLTLVITSALILMSCTLTMAQNEDDFNDLLCRTISGEREVRHYYTYGDGQQSYVVVDCETDEFVIEGGLDGRGSLDSLQQALFFRELTGKMPAVAIYDSDGEVGRFEHRIQAACEAAGVLFLNLDMSGTQDRKGLAEVFGMARQ